LSAGAWLSYSAFFSSFTSCIKRKTDTVCAKTLAAYQGGSPFFSVSNMFDFPAQKEVKSKKYCDLLLHFSLLFQTYLLYKKYRGEQE